MTSPTSDRRAVITDALRRIDDLTERLAIAQQSEREPIAVVGIGCRLPGGVTNPEEYWDFLDRGGDGVVRVPADRWDADALFSPDHTVPGTICNREGGFLAPWDPAAFDAEFFGISPREAAGMDPQHRLLLEVAWEALEDGGIVPASLRGTRTGVYVGLTTTDYSTTLAGELSYEEIDPYVPFGSAHNFAAGRLSYFLGLNGPAVVLDTACSSSLTALHLAAQGLRRREADAALVAGVNLILSPENSIACSRWGMLAPDGRCKPFDATADGYVRSEGCGVVVLKRLTDATRDGDRILALVRGTAVNQDGASSGQTVPNGPAQQALLRQALAASDLSASQIDLIESHGTGTALGDPIELDTLDRVFGDRAGGAPLVVGAVKSNLGHLESAAGIAGFIKTVLALQRGRIPGNLHFGELTPHAATGAAQFVFPTATMDWPSLSRPRRAGVSSFGVSGTNAHVVLEQAPTAAATPEGAEPGTGAGAAVHRLVVSGKTVERVAASAAQLADWIDGVGGTVALPDIAHELAFHRSRFPRVATVVAADHAAAEQALRALAAGRPGLGVVPPRSGGHVPGVVFVFSGQGAQWTGMGRRLIADEPAFAAAVRDLDPDFERETGFSLEQALTSGEPLVGIDRIQPVLVGVQLALVELWRAYGVTPDAVIGHSMGEVAAAVTAGALSVADGLRVIATRSRLMRRDLAGRGAMAMLELSAADASSLVAAHEGVSVAVVASPRQTVIAGEPDQVDAVIAEVSARDLLARRVEVDVASHHATVDPILDELRDALSDIAPAEPRIPFHSTVRPGEDAPVVDADYWADNLRRPVRFADAVSAAAEHGTFVEVSPHPLLSHAITDTVGADAHRVLGTLLRDAPEAVAFHTSLTAVTGPQYPEKTAGQRPSIGLPTMSWQRKRHWITPQRAAIADAAGSESGPDGGPHGWFLQLDHPARHLESEPLGPQVWLVLAADGGADLAALLGPGSTDLPTSALDDAPATVRDALATADRVVFAPAVPSDCWDPAAVRTVTNQLGSLVRLLRDADRPPRLTVLTRNAEAVDDGDVACPVHAALWGAGRTLALEHPEFWAGLIDLDAAAPPRIAARVLLAEAGSTDDEDQVLYRAGVRRVPRLRWSEAATGRTDLARDGAQLVVGATGNIGADVVRQLARMGAGTVVAVSRRGGLPDGLEAEVAEFGTRLIPVAVDAAERTAMTALIERFGADLPELSGVYVTALAGGAGQLADLTSADVDAMFRPKIDVLALLHELTLDAPVRDFVIFSSITGIIGSRWLGHYTAANAYADAAAAVRRRLGLPARVIDWGLFASWAEAQPDTASAGLLPMPNDDAVRCLPYLLGPDAPTRAVVVGADWPRLAENFRTRAPLRVVDELIGKSRRTVADLPVPRHGLLLGAPAGGPLVSVSAHQRPYPRAHRVRGVEVVPVSVLAATLAAAASSNALSDVRFEYPVVVDRPRAVRVEVGRGEIVLTTSTDPDVPAEQWIRHASAVIGEAGAAVPGDAELPDPSAATPAYDATTAEQLARRWGIDGRPFAWDVTDHEAGPGELRATVVVPAEAANAAALDAAVHLARLTGRIDDGLMLPASVDRIIIHDDVTGGRVGVRAVRRRDRGDDLIVDVFVTGDDDRIRIELRGLRFTLLEAHPDPALIGADPTDAPPAPVVQDLAAMAPERVEAVLQDALREVLARELGTHPHAVDVDLPFPELGLDSMMAMAVLRDAKSIVGMDLSATMLWDHPTVARLSRHITALIAPRGGDEAAPDAAAPSVDDEAGLLDELFDSVETLSEGEGTN
ncbi:SDR family NAD(P)-dependent oxidoreductase [Tsukamurella asaccharolytica]|uniref:SDR family NAD(P)-dependent oxidoreductase n=1 Tax=Tsukamurella asaccharolytica TaxID=2592067 RepID=A0A5C5RAX8_9ACTN|nr:type I polyketide synthase [Tsukamurella asaccharolytica]TWS19918.1 SDR family NAD(P)-dependent oxidoreductase [Tsukamurella asaccharolytica]